MTKILPLQNSAISYLRITKSMYRCLVIFFIFFLNKNKRR